jgi:hypothetical protein
MFFCGGTSTIDHYNGTLPGDTRGWWMDQDHVRELSSNSIILKGYTSQQTVYALLGIFTGAPDVPVFWFMAMYAVAIRIHMARYHKPWAAAAEFQADSPCTGWRGGASWRLDVGDFERMVESYGPIQANFKGNSQVIHTYMRYIHIYTYDIYIDTYLHDTRFIRTQYTHTINIYIYMYCIHNIYNIHMLYIYIMHENVWSCLLSSGTDAVF